MKLHGLLPGLFRGQDWSKRRVGSGSPSFHVHGSLGRLFPAAAAWRSNRFRDSPAPCRSQLDPYVFVVRNEAFKSSWSKSVERLQLPVSISKTKCCSL